MGLRGSRASVVAPGGRLQPPRALSQAERKVWAVVVGASAPEHFTRADEALLVAFCGAAVVERQAAVELRQGPVVDGRRLSPWILIHEKAVRSLGTLAVRLRLGPSSRSDPKTIARRSRGPANIDALSVLGLNGEHDE